MKSWMNTVLCISLSVMCLFACMGYAAISGQLTVRGNTETPPLHEVMITSITDGEGVSDGSATVNHYWKTIANLSVSLDSDAASSKTMHITILNNTIDHYTFKGVQYTEGEYTYSNPNITFEINGFAVGNKLAPGGYAHIDITFSYDTYRGYAEALNAVLDFHFGLAGESEGTDYESYILLFLSNGNGYGLNDSHKGDVVLSSLKQNKVIYAEDNLNAGNLKHLLTAINTDQTENLYFVYEYISETKIQLYTYEDAYNDTDHLGSDVTVYKTTFTRESVGSTYTEWSPSSSIHGTATVKNIRTPMGASLCAIDIGTWSKTEQS